jgi:hypothetical protein
MIGWFKRTFLKSARELVCVSYLDADRMIRENSEWRIAPEEDRNANKRVVYLERPSQQHSEQQ